jgi:hypothetical protein
MAIQPGRFNFPLQRRADHPITLRFKDSAGAAINLTGWTVAMQAWNQPRTTKYADAAITYADRAGGEIDALFTNTQTADFPNEVFYDVLLTNPSGLKEYYLEGIIYVSEGYTA